LTRFADFAHEKIINAARNEMAATIDIAGANQYAP
jgi:hypothetical protein